MLPTRSCRQPRGWVGEGYLREWSLQARWLKGSLGVGGKAGRFLSRAVAR